MPTPTKGPRLGGSPAHQKLILANLAISLIEHGSIKTTDTRAKRLRPYVERLITKAKRGDLSARRQVLASLNNNKGAAAELFEQIAPKLSERPGGYTRITKIANRKGDNAPMAVIELVLEPYSPKQATVKEAEAATKRAAKSAPAEEVPAEESEESVESAPSADSVESADSASSASAPSAEESEEVPASGEAESTDEK